MAQAMKRIWPKTKLAIGPPIEEGFYYDVDPEQPLTDEDLPKIEAEMAKIIASDYAFQQSFMEKKEAEQFFLKKGEPYKAEIVRGIPDEKVSIFTDGDFLDLCEGPHIQSTKQLKAIKLLSVAGAYWRGSEKNPQLTRIYGTAFFSQKELDDFLTAREEAKKRDHRKVGKELDLFIFTPFAAASPIFKPKGAVIYNLLQDYIRNLYRQNNYQEVITPQIFDVELWKKSGHYEKYKDNMYFTHVDEKECAIKPMNCPSHALIYASELRSYRDLPLRIADFGRLHRYERTGVTSGLTRVRTFSQDDAHIFCLEDQIGSEIADVCRMIRKVYETFGFPNPKVLLATRPERKVGSDALWDKAEAALKQVVEENNHDYTINAGDGAFYGPKIDFIVQDALGRDWQLGTIQLDFNMPERFGLEYNNAQGGTSRPVMIHRAVLGSLERFIGVLIEHYGGAFPAWLAPVQAKIIPISQDQEAYAAETTNRLKAAGFRVETDNRPETLQSRIRDAQLEKVPYMLIVGKREAQAGKVAVRARKEGDLGAVTVEEFIERLTREVETKQ
jgi:threonyl-tRNA synthetase